MTNVLQRLGAPDNDRPNVVGGKTEPSRRTGSHASRSAQINTHSDLDSPPKPAVKIPVLSGRKPRRRCEVFDLLPLRAYSPGPEECMSMKKLAAGVGGVIVVAS